VGGAKEEALMRPRNDKPVIYTAGPFRGRTQWEQVKNVRAAEAAALMIWSMGGIALCPHLNTANFQGALPDAVWAEGYLQLLRGCDAVYRLPGWETSSGTLEELREAEARKIPVVWTEAMLARFILGFSEGGGYR
jgi:hypothetical protein